MATIKQKKALERIIENHGNISRAMKEAGYDDTTAKNPSNLTNSKGFQQLLRDNGLDEDKFKDKLKEWIDAVKIQSSMTEPDRVVPDYQTQLKAGDMLSELLGITGKNQVNILNQGDMTVSFE